MSLHFRLSPETLARIERNRANALEKRRRILENSMHDSTSLQEVDQRSIFTPRVDSRESQTGPCSFQGRITEIRESNDLSVKSKSIVLSEEQIHVCREVLVGKSIFLTGCGGTGKSYLTNHLIEVLKEKHGKVGVAVTATTGIAACHIGGTSLHTFAGIGLGQNSVHELIERVSKNKRSFERWRKTKCLIIDEVSMLDGDLFDKLEELARNIRRNDKPFGGLQLLLVGDFLQLPPVKKQGGNVRFCFEAQSWSKVIGLSIELKSVFRQRNSDFITMLNSIRLGVCTPEILHRLTSTPDNHLADCHGVQATRLYPTNADVDRINKQKLDELPGELIVIPSEDSGEASYIEALDKSCLAPQKLCIKIGAQVMLLKNLDTEGGLTNGSRGVIDAVVENEEKGNKVMAPRIIFETKEGYISRIMKKETFDMESLGKIVASRTQYPLRLAYAITIHKCQGMTLNKVELSLKGVFEFGQAYVALSRASDLQGLRLIDFNPAAVRAHPRVLEFYKRMEQDDARTSPSTSRVLDSILPEYSNCQKDCADPAPKVAARPNPLFLYE